MLTGRVSADVAVIVDRCHTYACKGDVTAALLHQCAAHWLHRGVEWLNDGSGMDRGSILSYKLKFRPRSIPYLRWSPAAPPSPAQPEGAT